MSVPKEGEIRAVTGGYGLMVVLAYDAEKDAVQMRSHGPAGKTGYWFPASRLGPSGPVGEEAVLRERKEARARDVACNNPDCWCRRFP